MDTNTTEHPTGVMAFNQDGGTAFFVASPEAAGEARRWVGAYLLASDDTERLDDARLATTELVTNAIREELIVNPMRDRVLFAREDGAAVICVRIVRASVSYRIEVYDGSPEIPPGPREESAPAEALRGRGLSLVDALTSQRGWMRYTDHATGRNGKCVWFTLPRDKPEMFDGLPIWRL